MADISKIKTLDGTTYNIKDASARSSIPAAATTAPKMDGTAAVGTSAKYAKEDHVHPSDTTKWTINNYGQGTTDLSVRPLIAYSRANRLAFLPADQIIIETTTDGGNTWISGGYSDSAKKSLFATRGVNVAIPLLNGAKSTNCGVRITITGMKYNVPEGTSETEKYNYWNSNYIKSQERYSNLREMWFWISANNDAIRVQVYRATGAKPDTWIADFNTDFPLTGWSGSDWIRLSGNTFGGGTTQTSNYWNWRIIFWSRMLDGDIAFRSATQQVISGIAGYGDNVWGTPNPLMKEDHLYSWDNDMNATFPAKVTATSFSGSLTGNASSATKATQDESGNNIKASYAASMSINDHTITLKNKNGTSLGTVTVPDSGGTSDYTDLSNKPSINGTTLSGNKTAAQLGLATPSDIPTIPVQSVNGKTGAVVLSASDVSALPDDTAIPSKTSDLTNDSGFLTSAPVTSVNNKTGDVTLTASDVGAGTYSKPSDGIPASDLASAVQTSLGKADTALQSVPSTYRTAAAQDIIDAAQDAEITNLKINHRNLLDNWYFIGTGSQNGVGYFPINQRGQQSYSGSGYGIDRWRAGGNAPSNFTTTTSNSGLTIKDARTSGTNTNWFNQNFDRPLRPGTYTLSALISSISGSGKIGILNDSNTYISNDAKQDITTGLTTVTFTVSDSTATKVAIVINAATTVKISAIKLELGSYQTLAHQKNGTWVLNEFPSYDEELLKCQKYFQIIPPCGSYLVPIGSGIGYDTTQIRINLPLITAMVKTPTVTVQNCSIRFYQDSLSSAITTYSSVSAATGGGNAHYRPYAILIFTVSGAINGKKAELVINTSGGDNPGILLSAEE